MIMLFRQPSNARTYRLHAHVTARGLPAGEKALRLRCTLSAADHTILGVSTLLISLGAGQVCDQVLELLHDPRGGEPPATFELILSVSPQSAPHTRVPLERDGVAVGGDPYHYRVAGVVDPTSDRIALPDIVLIGA
jgi:hypothetical protein